MINIKPPKPKYTDEQKQLCSNQTNLINEHVKTCNICKISFESYKQNFGIASTPPCNDFLTQLRNHIDNCAICYITNQRWNEDAIPVTPAMRILADQLGRGIIPDKKALEGLIDELKKKLGNKRFQ